MARFAGEEFVILSSGTELSEMEEFMERVRAATPAPLTCSIGLAQWNFAETPERLIDRADLALYQTKETGRNRIVVLPGTSTLSSPTTNLRKRVVPA